MVNLSDFGEKFEHILLEHETTVTEIEEKTGITHNSLYAYLGGKNFPSLSTAIKLATYFDCSLDYLLGRTDANYKYKRKDMPDFGIRLKELFETFGSNEYRLHKGTKISRSLTHAWLTGKSKPSIDNLIKIADFYGCSVDFVIGIEN